MANDFVHLHLHTQYSLLDGANRVDRLIDRVRELGMSAVAMTDHGNLYGAVDFYSRARQAGIQPILGIEAYVAPDLNGRESNRRDKTRTGVADGGFHLVLLAETLRGWGNLLKLSTDSFLHGFYYKPRMDKSTLVQWGEGLIAINGHLGSSIAFHLDNLVKSSDESHWQRAVEEARWHAETFKPNAEGEPRFYIELQKHIPEQEAINPHLIRLARELDLPLVCDNDAHFLLEEDWDSHDSLVCISTGKIKDEPQRMKYPPDLYVKSPAEMWELFGDYAEGAGREALENTNKIARRCNLELDLDQNHAPVVKVRRSQPEEEARHPKGSTAWFNDVCSTYELQPFDGEKDTESPEELKKTCDQALRELSEAGLVWRYGEEGINEAIRARLDRELGILAAKDISSYFLIVWDFVQEARRRGIPAGARGSGVGTMVGYCLGLSHACPENYGLLFERFTDPDRSEYPDIDIDICQDGRGEILDYVRRKYDPANEGKVAQIITFNVLKAKAAIRDVGRVMNIPLQQVDKVCKMVGDQLNITLDAALAQSPDLKKLYDEDPEARKWVDTARKLEGLARHAGVHAAGVVLGNERLDNVLPLAINKQGDKETVVTQWDGPTCERVGLLKMDFLGLRTLSIIERARPLVKQTLDEAALRATVDPEGAKPANWDPLDLDRLTFDDDRVLDLFRRGETVSVFQFESDGMRRLLRAMAPDRREDIIAANALDRPGPMALIDDYNNRKHGRQQVPSSHPIIEKYTHETHGIMIYQEQVMQIVHELGDIPLRAAYSLIKAISKKKEKTINAQKAQFLKGAQEKGVAKPEATKIFDLILKFAGYGFNKSHSTGYAIVAYQTAYLKNFFPVQYMAAVLTFEAVNTDKVVKYIEECSRARFPDGHRGIDVRAPDINTSGVGFTPVFAEDEPHDANHGYIRFGLAAVKGVGEKAVSAIIEERRRDGVFKSLWDFCERVSSQSANKSTMEALIKCGAFDRVHDTDSRAALIEALEGAMQAGQRMAADRASGQSSLFGMLGGGGGEDTATAPEPKLPAVPPWEPAHLLKEEKSVLGFYVSSHPLDQHLDVLRRYASVCAVDLRHLSSGQEVLVGGLVTQVRERVTQRGRSAGQKMAILGFEDKTGPIDSVVFSETYARCSPLLEEDRVVFLQGKVQQRDGTPSLVVDRVVPIESAAELTRGVRVIVRAPEGVRNGAASKDGARSSDRNPSPEAMADLKKRLTRLRDFFWDRASGPGQAATLRISVLADEKVYNVGVGNMKVKVSGDMPRKIEEILGHPDCCELLGPPRLAIPQIESEAGAA